MKTTYTKGIIIFSGAILLQQCCPYDIDKGNNQYNNIINMHSSSVPRGMIDVSCKVMNITNKNGTTFCNVKIDKVYGYGSDVRPIAAGIIYKVEIAKYLLKNNSLHDNLGKTILCRLVSIQNGMGQEEKNKMKITSINIIE